MQPPQDVNVGRRSPRTQHQLKNADVVCKEAVVAGKVAPPASAEAPVVVSGHVADVPPPFPARPAQNNLSANRSQVLTCEFRGHALRKEAT